MRKFSLTLLVCAIAGSATAATFVVPSDRDMLRRSDAVVVGEALTSYTQKNANGGIETITSLSVREVIKGAVMQSTLTLREPGGVYGNEATIIPGVPRFTDGEQVLVFLRRTGASTWAVTEIELGKFTFAVDDVGRKLAIRNEESINGWSSDGTTYVERRRGADQFLAFLRSEARGILTVADYFVSTRPIAQTIRSQSLRQAISATPTSYMSDLDGVNGPGARIATFPMFFFTTPGTSANAISATNVALAAWTNDPLSAVDYRNGGTDPCSGGCKTTGLSAPDNLNTILFERDLLSWGIDPFTCPGNGSYGGTLGIGGVTRTLNTHVGPAGETFYTTVEVDVEMNKNTLGCTALVVPGDFNTALAHEVGHTLGFRHSDQTRKNNPGIPCGGAGLECSTLAVMKSFVPNGINATLQAYDQNAVRTVYPGTAPRPRGDFNGDGKSDIFWRDTATGQNVTWLMNGFSANGANTTAILPPFQVVGTGDFNGDGKADLLWRNQTTGQNYIWLMDGFHPFNGSPFTSVPPPWVVSGVGDTNLDGKADIVWRNPATGANAIWLMDSFVNTASANIATVPDPNWSIVAVADFNGDGRSDLLWRNAVNGLNQVWLVNGLTVTNGAGIPSVPDPNFFVAGTGDFNGDGRYDILWRNDATGGMFIWHIDGFSANGAPLPNIGDNNWRPRAIGDWDGDGKADIMLRNVSNGLNYLWFVNGFTVVNGGPIPTVPALSWNPQAPR